MLRHLPHKPPAEKQHTTQQQDRTRRQSIFHENDFQPAHNAPRLPFTSGEVRHFRVSLSATFSMSEPSATDACPQIRIRLCIISPQITKGQKGFCAARRGRLDRQDFSAQPVLRAVNQAAETSPPLSIHPLMIPSTYRLDRTYLPVNSSTMWRNLNKTKTSIIVCLCNAMIRWWYLSGLEDQTRPEQTRPDQTRPDQTRLYISYPYTCLPYIGLHCVWLRYTCVLAVYVKL